MSPWIQCWRPRPNADVRLIAFSWAGGGASAYRTWHEAMPPEVEVSAVQLPGREDRITEEPIADLGAIVQALADNLAPKLDRATVFFGHSFGAVLAFELAAHLLRASARQAPRLLLISGRPAPHVAARVEPVHTLPPAEFFKAVMGRYQAIPAALLRETELLEAILPALRADFTISDRYRQIEGPLAPIAIPIIALGGKADAVVPPEELEAWRICTSKEFRAFLFEGGHFYLNEAASKARVLSLVADALGELIW